MEEEFEGLNLIQLLDLLEAAPEPARVSLTPQTGGWAVLAVVIVLLLFAGVRWAMRRHRASAYRRAALRELASANAEPAVVASILRRTALVAYPREDVATLSGAEWLAFLDQSYAGSGFADGPGRVFATAPFRPTPPNPAATALACDWIRRHRKSAPAS